MRSRGQTREHLLATAAGLFHRQGFAATGMAQILEQSATGSGSLYHFFKNKEDLLQGVLERYAERFETEIAAPAREQKDPIDRLFAILSFYSLMLEQTACELGCPVGNLAGELADSHDSVRAGLAGLFELWRSEIKNCLDDARDRFPPETDREALAMLVLSVMEGGVMQARVERSLRPFENSVAMLRDYIDRLQAQANP
ncbi:MAG: TetR/AcrR family transcriptional regulator [Planctomycetota bacterium]|jgi:AcrR family transcriptional regulator